MSIKKFAKGAAILTFANVATRIMGFFYRIFMSNAIGSEGMGLYQLIMPIYILAWSISSAGMSTAVSKLTAQQNACGKTQNVTKLLFTACAFSFFTATLLSVVLNCFSSQIAEMILCDLRTATLLKILALSFPFMACGSCIRGFFMGLQKHAYPAASQIFEQVIRIVVIFTLYPMFFNRGTEYACTAAVIGIVAGEFFSFLLTALFLLNIFKYNSRNYMQKNSENSMHIFKILLLVSLPLSASKVSAALLSALENILIPSRLALFSTGTNSLALFGSLTGMAMPLIQFPSSVLVGISLSLVPAISEAKIKHSKSAVQNALSKCLQLTFIMAFFATGFFFLFAEDICTLIYNKPQLGQMLGKLAFLCPFIYTQITLNGILNGLGEHNFIFFSGILSSVINIFLIYFLMPLIGIDAFVISSALGLFISCTAGIKKCLQNSTEKEFCAHFFVLLCCLITVINLCKIITDKAKTNFLEGFLIFSAIYIFVVVLTDNGVIKEMLTALYKNKK